MNISVSPSVFDGDAAAVERRQGPRRRVFLAGRALVDDGRIIEVTFRDMSERGARLLVAPPAILRGLVPVLLLREGLVFRAHVIWNHAPMFGVAFNAVTDLRTARPEPYEPLAAIWDAWRTAPQAECD
ncbi:MAG TPA: PilZ domain-containing protein [Stellaceae bacterium]|jgi:hypothetical protein|nr:PilZ domain-containing protein [Stellaceae bacterium]